jgi:hypothetical protein
MGTINHPRVSGYPSWSLLQRFEGGRRAQVASFLLGGAMESVGSLGESGCGVAQ